PLALGTRLNSISEILEKQGQSEKIVQTYKEALAAYSNDQSVKNAIAESLMVQARNQYKDAAQQTPREAIKSFKIAERLLNLAFSASKNITNSTTEQFQSALNTLVEKRFAGGAEGDVGVETENCFKELLDMKLESSNDGD